MRILLTGRNGQVGRELERVLPALGDVVATDRRTLDLTDSDAIRRVIRETKPRVIVNAAAYTAVDKAESELDLATKVNTVGPGVLGEEARRFGAYVLHYSTDYVFDGEKPTPYVENDATNPLNAYGRSKLGGEQAIQRSGCRHLILRTSWVYSRTGKNFLVTMLRLSTDKKELRVVDDQLGAPTSTSMLAQAALAVIAGALRDSSRDGIYHMTASGSTTWCGFARAILGDRVKVVAISSREYPTPARRPRNSVLDNSKLYKTFGIRLAHWEAGLREALA